MRFLGFVEIEPGVIARNRNHVEKALEVTITIDGIEKFFKGHSRDQLLCFFQSKSSHLRAAFSVAGDADFDEGLRRVADLLREEMKSTKK